MKDRRALGGNLTFNIEAVEDDPDLKKQIKLERRLKERMLKDLRKEQRFKKELTFGQ